MSLRAVSLSLVLIPFLSLSGAENAQRTVVCYGTSLTRACGYPEMLQTELERRWEGRFKVLNRGGAGQNSRWGLANLQKMVVGEKPDVVFVEFSMNDAVDRFRLSLEESESNTVAMVTRLRAALPRADIVLMTMNPYTGEPPSKRARLPAYYEVYRRVADVHRLKLIDHYSVWEDFRRENVRGYAECVPDGTHPSGVGVRRVMMPRLLEYFFEKATSVGLEDLRLPVLDGRRVAVSGYLREVFADEAETNRLVAIFKYGSESAYLTFRGGRDELARLRDLVSAKIAVKGEVVTSARGGRLFEGPCLADCSLADISVLEPAPSDVFSAKLLEMSQPADPKHISALLRRRLFGTVLAVWNGKFLLHDAGAPSYSEPPGGHCLQPVGRFHVIELAPDVISPTPGAAVEVVGFPATDLYGLNFLSALWRAAPGSAEEPAGVRLPIPSAPSFRHHGDLLTFLGTVTDVSREGTPELGVRCSSGTVVVPVDACPDVCGCVAAGSRLSLTGICVAERENWHGYSSYPRLKRILVVPRSRADVVILDGPSWWTPSRLVAVIGGLMLLVVVLAVRWAVDRRIARMRFADRTRLAVELHDSVSQNLTGVSMQIDAARELVAADPERLVRRLDIASRTIDSCREQMRNCIGDLRGDMLDCDDFNRAIRAVLEPILKDALLTVRFNVPRKILSDGSAHAVFSIVRELVANAVRHGKASSVRVAGVMERGILRFSVSDDGVGFDPERRPGIEDGHFGLQGVGERVRALGGSFSVESVPGKGTRVSVEIANLRGT